MEGGIDGCGNGSGSGIGSGSSGRWGSHRLIDVTVDTIVMDAIDVMDVNSWSTIRSVRVLLNMIQTIVLWNTLASMTQ